MRPIWPDQNSSLQHDYLHENIFCIQHKLKNAVHTQIIKTYVCFVLYNALVCEFNLFSGSFYFEIRVFIPDSV
jgi:hypothetical protein